MRFYDTSVGARFYLFRVGTLPKQQRYSTENDALSCSRLSGNDRMYSCFSISYSLIFSHELFCEALIENSIS